MALRIGLRIADDALVSRIEHHFSPFPEYDVLPINVHNGRFDAQVDVVVVPVCDLRTVLAVPLPPLVVIIGYGPAEYLERARLSGCRHYIKEPWHVEELYWLVHGEVAEITLSWCRFNSLTQLVETAVAVGRLPDNESAILAALSRKPGACVPAVDLVCSNPRFGSAASVVVYVNRLRTRLAQLGVDRMSVFCSRGKGYGVVP